MANTTKSIGFQFDAKTTLAIWAVALFVSGVVLDGEGIIAFLLALGVFVWALFTLFLVSVMVNAAKRNGATTNWTSAGFLFYLGALLVSMVISVVILF